MASHFPGFDGGALDKLHVALFLVIAFSTVVSWAAPAEVMDVKIGMLMQDVIGILGEPDRKAVLSGKLLRDFTEISSEEITSHSRIVFIYNKDNVQVWFRDGRVTGMTKNGISIRHLK